MITCGRIKIQCLLTDTKVLTAQDLKANNGSVLDNIPEQD